MKSFKTILFILLAIASSFPLSAQNEVNADSISLSGTLKQVMNNYPAIKKNEQDQYAADARIGLAKSAYYPEVSINSSYSHIGPVSSITMPGLGIFSFYPTDNFSASLNYNQTLYDFGKTAKSVAYENQSKELVNMSGTQLKQKLSLAVVNIYYSVVFLQEAIKIKDEQISTLNQHLHFIEKKVAIGSATQYELLTTQVRISAIENQKTDLLTSLKVQCSQLNSLLGKPENTTLLVKKELQAIEAVVPTDSLLSLAVKSRNEMKMAEQKTMLSELHYKTVGMQNNPVFNVFASGGVKNGYTPDINEQKLNYVLGLGLRIPLFDATRTKYSRMQAKTEIESSKEDVELCRRNIANEVVESQANIASALQKISQSELQLQQAQKAYNLAETSFKSGVITNLELLDSSTSLSEAGLSVLKAKIDYSLSLLKLKIAVGVAIY